MYQHTLNTSLYINAFDTVVYLKVLIFDDYYYDQYHNFVYILIFIIFITCHMFSGMVL